MLSLVVVHVGLLELVLKQGATILGLTASKTIQVIVGAVNDAPVIEAPLTFFTEEDTRVSLADVTIEDPDCDDTPRGVLEVTVASSNGTVEFRGSVAGLYLMETLPSFLKIRGRPGPINAALAGLSYLGAAEFHGQDVINITADDLGNSGEGGAFQISVPINIIVTAVNDPPRLVVPSKLHRTEGGTLFVEEDTPISIGNFGVTDPDDDIVRVKVSSRVGTLSTAAIGGGSSLVILENYQPQESSSTSSVTFEGKTEEVSAALKTLNYSGPLNWNSVSDDRDLVKASRHRTSHSYEWVVGEHVLR